MRCLLILTLLLLVVATPVVAQEIGPEASILGKATFGINGSATLEVALPTEYSYNPAAIPLSLKMFKEKTYVESDYGVLDFDSGPKVINDYEMVAFRVGNSAAARIGRYGITSNRQGIAFFGEGPLGEFRGESLELCYGEFISPKATVGIAIVPKEEIRTILTMQGEDLATAKASSSLQMRIGGLYLLSSKASVGLVYAYDNIDSVTQLSPVLTGLAETVDLTGNYQERLWTLGAAYQPQIGTALFVAWQKGSITGPNLDEPVNLLAYGVNQYFNEHLSVKVMMNDRVPGYEVSYEVHGWTTGISIARNTSRQTEEFLGRADITYLWVSKSW